MASGGFKRVHGGLRDISWSIRGFQKAFYALQCVLRGLRVSSKEAYGKLRRGSEEFQDILEG